MSFYEFLWEAVRRPELLRRYAEELGLDLPDPPQGFYERLRYVAEALPAVMAREPRDVPQWTTRCMEARRFHVEASMDLREAGLRARLPKPC